MISAAAAALLTISAIVRWRSSTGAGSRPSSDLFLAILALYTAPILIEYAFLLPSGRQPIVVRILHSAGYGLDQNAAGLATISFVLGFLVVTSRTRLRHINRSTNYGLVPPPLSPNILAASTAAVCLTALAIVEVRMGFLRLLSSARGAERDSTISYLLVIYASLYCASILAHVNNSRIDASDQFRKSHRRIRSTSLAVLLILSLIAGDRRYLVFLIVALVLLGYNPSKSLAEKIVVRRTFRARLTKVLLAGTCCLLLLLVAKYRWALPKLWSGELGWKEVASRTREGDTSLEFWRPSTHEFGGPAMSLFSWVDFEKSDLGSHYSHSAGVSYLEGLVSALPWEEKADLAFDYATTVNRAPDGSGYGFSPIAEAAMNFGWYFACMGGAIVGAIFNLIDHLRMRRSTYYLGNILIFLAIDLSRISFSLREASYVSLVTIVLLIQPRVRPLSPTRGPSYSWNDSSIGESSAYVTV